MLKVNAHFAVVLLKYHIDINLCAYMCTKYIYIYIGKQKPNEVRTKNETKSLNWKIYTNSTFVYIYESVPIYHRPIFYTVLLVFQLPPCHTMLQPFLKCFKCFFSFVYFVVVAFLWLAFLELPPKWCGAAKAK